MEECRGAVEYLTREVEKRKRGDETSARDNVSLLALRNIIGAVQNMVVRNKSAPSERASNSAEEEIDSGAGSRSRDSKRSV